MILLTSGMILLTRGMPSRCHDTGGQQAAPAKRSPPALTRVLRVRSRQVFDPDRAMPSTICFWAMMNTISIGSAAIDVAAIRLVQSDE